MPCRWEPTAEELAAPGREIDRLTDMLCRVLGGKTSAEIKKLPGDVQAWWRDHQLRDAARKAEEESSAQARVDMERRHYEELKRKFG